MVKNSAEGQSTSPSLLPPPADTTISERIMQVGKKKLALDHVIVQKMDDEIGEDVQSILTFGAQQLFQDQDTDRGITCSWACYRRSLFKLNDYPRFRGRRPISDREDREGRGPDRGNRSKPTRGVLIRENLG